MARPLTESSLKPYWFYQSHLRTFLSEENEQIVLATITMFTRQLCNVLQITTINRFSKKKLKWPTDNFFTPVINNFHRCEQRYVIYKNDSLSLMVSLVVGAAATSLNISIAEVENSSTASLFFEVGTYNFDYKMRYVTSPIFNGYYGLLIPPSEPYSPLEKLLLPFDFQIWIWFSVVFAVAYLVVFIVSNFSDTEVKVLIVGKKVKAPAVNVFLIFMGGGLIVLPSKNFPRFLIMSFILYCLIMR